MELQFITSVTRQLSKKISAKSKRVLDIIVTPKMGSVVIIR